MGARQEKSSKVWFRPFRLPQVTSLFSLSLPSFFPPAQSLMTLALEEFLLRGVPGPGLGAQRKGCLVQVEHSVKSHLEDAPLSGAAS